MPLHPTTSHAAQDGAFDRLSDELTSFQRRLSGRHLAASAIAADLGRFVGRMGRRLDMPPRVVLLGEFNSGKSTLANALIGAEVLPTSIHANTRVPLLIHHADVPTLTYDGTDGERRPFTPATVSELRQGLARMLRVGLPLPQLKRFELIDTPGLAHDIPGATAFRLEACRRAHIAVWCTVATQAWKASEQAAWNEVPCRLRQRSLLAVTHRDAIHSERDSERLMARLEAEVAPQFGGIVMVAAADALTASRSGTDRAARWSASGGLELEQRLAAVVGHEMESRRTAAQRVLQRVSERLLSRPQVASRPLLAS